MNELRRKTIERNTVDAQVDFNFLMQLKLLTVKALGFFLPVQHWGRGGGGVFHPPCKIRSRHPRKLKFTVLIAYVMLNKICKFESLTIINDVITKNSGKMRYFTLTSIKFDPDSQKPSNLER